MSLPLFNVFDAEDVDAESDSDDDDQHRKQQGKERPFSASLDSLGSDEADDDFSFRFGAGVARAGGGGYATSTPPLQQDGGAHHDHHHHQDTQDRDDIRKLKESLPDEISIQVADLRCENFDLEQLRRTLFTATRVQTSTRAHSRMTQSILEDMYMFDSSSVASAANLQVAQKIEKNQEMRRQTSLVRAGSLAGGSMRRRTGSKLTRASSRKGTMIPFGQQHRGSGGGGEGKKNGSSTGAIEFVDGDSDLSDSDEDEEEEDSFTKATRQAAANVYGKQNIAQQQQQQQFGGGEALINVDMTFEDALRLMLSKRQHRTKNRHEEDEKSISEAVRKERACAELGSYSGNVALFVRVTNHVSGFHTTSRVIDLALSDESISQMCAAGLQQSRHPHVIYPGRCPGVVTLCFFQVPKQRPHNNHKHNSNRLLQERNDVVAGSADEKEGGERKNNNKKKNRKSKEEKDRQDREESGSENENIDDDDDDEEDQDGNNSSKKKKFCLDSENTHLRYDRAVTRARIMEKLQTAQKLDKEMQDRNEDLDNFLSGKKGEIEADAFFKQQEVLQQEYQVAQREQQVVAKRQARQKELRSIGVHDALKSLKRSQQTKEEEQFHSHHNPLLNSTTGSGSGGNNNSNNNNNTSTSGNNNNNNTTSSNPHHHQLEVHHHNHHQHEHDELCPLDSFGVLKNNITSNSSHYDEKGRLIRNRGAAAAAARKNKRRSNTNNNNSDLNISDDVTGFGDAKMLIPSDTDSDEELAAASRGDVAKFTLDIRKRVSDALLEEKKADFMASALATDARQTLVPSVRTGEVSIPNRSFGMSTTSGASTSYLHTTTSPSASAGLSNTGTTPSGTTPPQSLINAMKSTPPSSSSSFGRGGGGASGGHTAQHQQQTGNESFGFATAFSQSLGFGDSSSVALTSPLQSPASHHLSVSSSSRTPPIPLSPQHIHSVFASPTTFTNSASSSTFATQQQQQHHRHHPQVLDRSELLPAPASTPTSTTHFQPRSRSDSRKSAQSSSSPSSTPSAQSMHQLHNSQNLQANASMKIASKSISSPSDWKNRSALVSPSKSTIDIEKQKKQADMSSKHSNKKFNRATAKRIRRLLTRLMRLKFEVWCGRSLQDPHAIKLGDAQIGITQLLQKVTEQLFSANPSNSNSNSSSSSSSSSLLSDITLSAPVSAMLGTSSGCGEEATIVCTISLSGSKQHGHHHHHHNRHSSSANSSSNSNTAAGGGGQNNNNKLTVQTLSHGTTGQQHHSRNQSLISGGGGDADTSRSHSRHSRHNSVMSTYSTGTSLDNMTSRMTSVSPSYINPPGASGVGGGGSSSSVVGGPRSTNAAGAKIKRGLFDLWQPPREIIIEDPRRVDAQREIALNQLIQYVKLRTEETMTNALTPIMVKIEEMSRRVNRLGLIIDKLVERKQKQDDQAALVAARRGTRVK